MHVVVVVVRMWMSWCRRDVVTLGLAVSCGGGGGGGAGMSCLSLQLTGIWRKGWQPRALSARPRRVMHRRSPVTFTSSSLWYLSMSLLCRALTADEL
ncbi:hypothetical protein V8E55_004663 [Tylopilus felleus]